MLVKSQQSIYQVKQTTNLLTHKATDKNEPNQQQLINLYGNQYLYIIPKHKRYIMNMRQSKYHAEYEQYYNSDIFYSDQEQNEKTSDITEKKNRLNLLKKAVEMKLDGFQCDICEKRFSCVSSLLMHKQRKHGSQPDQQKSQKPQQQSKQFGYAYKNVTNTASSFNNSGQQEDQQQFLRSQKNSEYSANNYAKRNFNNEHSHQTSNTQKDQNKKSENICQKCGNKYNYYSALRAHIRSKHPDWQQGLKSRPHPHKKSKMVSAQCQHCGVSFPSKMSLFIHIANKHKIRTKMRIYHRGQKQSYEMQGSQQEQICGCGRVYGSRSALNMHVRRKHAGIYPPGCTEKVYQKRGTLSREEREFNQNVQNHLRCQRSASDDEESIYDSDVQFEKKDPYPKQHPIKQKTQQLNKTLNRKELIQRPIKGVIALKPISQKPLQKRTYARPIQGQKPFICGCGRTYTVSSSLNLHIKKAHNWAIPIGTIGGPRGLMGGQSQVELLKKNQIFHDGQSSVVCSLCSQATGIQYFKCKTCLNHVLCSQCFWGTNNFNKEHDWKVKRGI